jgi:organic radical activating enzyme
MHDYKINDIFYSLQGEGRNTGRAAVFVRFAGCNLRCPFCDTDFENYSVMTDGEILAAINGLWRVDDCDMNPMVVLTGGEPTLQVSDDFVELLHTEGYEVAMESNGILPAPRNIDWLTVSPKQKGLGWMTNGEARRPDELKVVFDEQTDPSLFLPGADAESLPLLYLQPCDTGDASRNSAIVKACVDYVKKHPCWRLSLQTHKLIGIE